MGGEAPGRPGGQVRVRVSVHYMVGAAAQSSQIGTLENQPKQDTLVILEDVYGC